MPASKKKSESRELVIANLDFRQLRQEKLNGRVYNVAPVVLMTEGVHAGSKGPVFYPEEELSKWSPSWDHKPILIDHPPDGSWAGNDPEVIEKQAVGFLLNTRYDTKQRSEGWFDAKETARKCMPLQNAIVNRQLMEVSTGLIVDAQDEEGEFGGVKYNLTARNHRPDHLAILVDKIGACSVEKGGGLWQLNESVENKMSHSEIHSQIAVKLREELGQSWDGFIADIFDKDFVYWEGAEMLRQKYSKNGDEVEFVEPPEKVQRKVEYKAVSNSADSDTQVEETDNMAKKDLVDKVIANKATKWEEKHRDKLAKMSDEDLELMIPVEAPPVVKNEKEQEEEEKEETEVKNTVIKPNEKKELTPQEWLNSVPTEFRGVITNALQFQKEEHKKAITSILNSDRGKELYTEEELTPMNINQLRKIQALVAPAVNPENEDLASYFGAANLVANARSGSSAKEEPMALPDYDAAYEKYAKQFN